MKKLEFRVVTTKESKIDPYPYVYIQEDGSSRELDSEERAYLEEAFHPNDGGRPYVKTRYSQLTPDGKMEGFLKRSKLIKRKHWWNMKF